MEEKRKQRTLKYIKEDLEFRKILSQSDDYSKPIKYLQNSGVDNEIILGFLEILKEMYGIEKVKENISKDHLIDLAILEKI